MIYEEAIEILEEVPDYAPACISLQEACDLAISVLKMAAGVKKQGDAWDEYARKLNDDEVKRLKSILERLKHELAKQ